MRNLLALVCLALLTVGLGACTKTINDAEELFRNGQEEAALEVAEGLMDHEDSRVRQRAVKLAGKIGGDRAGKLLVKAIRDPSPSVQAEAVRGLGAILYEPGIRAILEALPTADPDVLQAAGGALASYGSPATTELVRLYSTPSEKSNRPVYRQVLISVGASASEALIGTLKNRSFFENRDTFKILVAMQNPRVATLMLPFLENDEVAGQVAEAISRLGSKAVNPTLESIKKYKNDSEDERILELHIQILGKLKDVRAAETLEALATHPSERIRDAVDRALFQIRGY